MAVDNSTSRPILLPDCASSYPSSSKSSLEGSASGSGSSAESVPPGLAMTQSDKVNGTIRFAPLPQLSPRKRRSKPMGVAARSAYIRERRLEAAQTEIEDYRVHNPTWNDRLPEEEGNRVRSRERRDMETEDPFLVLGKMMKEAGKGIWKYVAHGDKSKSKGSEEKKESEVAVHEKGGLAQRAGDFPKGGKSPAFSFYFLYA
jgi:hypothetical protein